MGTGLETGKLEACLVDSSSTRGWRATSKGEKLHGAGSSGQRVSWKWKAKSDRSSDHPLSLT